MYCGQYFCEYCGDCMYCYGDDPCVADPEGGHWWVVEEKIENNLDNQQNL